MRLPFFATILLSVAACASVGPTTPPVPVTSHGVSAADYPRDSVTAQEQGATTLRYAIFENGTTGDVQIVKSSGFARLDQAAVDIVRSKWRFKPAMANGAPVRAVQNAEINFVLGPNPVSYLAVFVASNTSTPKMKLSAKASRRIAPIYAAYEQVERKQAALSPPKDDAERLVRLGEIDQAVRSSTLQKLDLSNLAPGERATAFGAMWAEINRHDLANQSALKAMLPMEGWFLKSRYGQEAVQAAFDIVYHTVNDKPLQRATLAAIEPLVLKGEIRSQAYAMLYDRVAISEGRPQRYGSAFICKDAQRTLAPLEDASQVDLWRKTIGFDLTAQENAARLMNALACR